MNTNTAIGIVVALVVVLGGGYYMLNGALYVANIQPVGVPADSSVATYSSPELGFAFDYRTGPEEYVLKEVTPAAADAGLVRTIVLTPAVDAATPPPVGGEGPATITINVFQNIQKQWPQTWADEHVQYSNVNLKRGDVAESVVGGANAIRYMADGLYASENVVVAHGEYVYVFTGMYIDAESQLRQDFAPLIDSVRFIPQPGQE